MVVSPLVTGKMKIEKTIKVLWQAVNESDEMPLSEAEEGLYTAVHLALMVYEDEVRLGHRPTERRCLICGLPVGVEQGAGQCCC